MENADILRKQEIGGKVLFTLTKEKLIAPPCNMLGGPATTLMAAIESLKAVRSRGAIVREGSSPC